MKTARVLTLAVAALGALTLVAIWQASAQEAAKGGQPQNPLGIQRFGAGTGSMAYFSSADPQMDKLRGEEVTAERNVANLLRDFSRGTDEALRGKIKTKLSEALEKQFDVQQQRRELEAARIEAQLKKLRELMKKRTDARQTIVEKRLDQLVREADGLGWTPPPSLGSPRALSGFGWQESGLQAK